MPNAGNIVSDHEALLFAFVGMPLKSSQGRFKSFLVEEESYLRQLVLYVHRNPLRAGMVERLSDYRWSSYLCLGYGRQCLPWLEREKVLRVFGSDQREFRSQVQSYSEEESHLLEDLRHGLLLDSEKAT
jgi:hypothetical protein